MEVVTFHVGGPCVYAPVMIRSAKRFGYRVVMMTDDATPIPEGVDEVVRIPWDGKALMVYRLRHLMEYPRDALFVDTDVVFKRDVSEVMARDFSVALTKRGGVILDPNGVNIVESMPYNAGVMFSKDRNFWARAYRASTYLSPQGRDWYGDQIAIAHAAAHYPRLLELSCDEYNYSPSRKDEDVSGRAIVHYKGKRKPWMLE